MKQIFLFGIIVFISGCATARLPQGPDIYSTHQYSEARAFGVVKVVDQREKKKAGTIGALTVNVDHEELAQITTNYLIESLNLKLQLNVSRISKFDPENIDLPLSNQNLNGFIVARIKKLKLFSVDAILQPVSVEIFMEIDVYNTQGQIVYSDVFDGYFNKRMGLRTSSEAHGELVESAVKTLMENLVKYRNFTDALSTI